MEFFKKYFSSTENWQHEEVKVLCPFHNDTNPSASINTEKGLFHCWVCNVGYNEPQFMARVNSITTTEAIRLLDNYSLYDEWQLSLAKLWSDPDFKQKLNELGLSDNTINEFKLGLVFDDKSNRKMLGVPVFYNNVLVASSNYNILKHQGMPKLINTGDRTGWVIPHDKFVASNEVCYFFEGEKDMLIARENGINAYTLTGGASAIPNEYSLSAFQGKDIVICYDNDKAGQEGAISLFSNIRDIVKSVRYIDISKEVKEAGEDFYDFIIKYNHDIFDFYSLPLYSFDPQDIKKNPRVTIKNALAQNMLKKTIKSLVTVSAEFSDPFSVPTVVNFEKLEEVSSKKDALFQGEKVNWYLEQKNDQQMLELIEASAKDIEVINKLKKFVGIPAKEPNLSVKLRELRTVYKSAVVDKEVDRSAISLDLYSFEKLDVGGQYLIEYKIHPHPTKHQKLVAVCSRAISIHDNHNFNLDRELLQKFQTTGTIQERLNYLYQSAKHYVAKHLNFDIWLMTDLTFNSILDFNYGETMRGALDVFFLGDTQVGKSETTSKLVELYNFGHFLSLKTSTTTGLIGGSSKVDGAYCNTIGAIPRQHKRLVVMEEFSGAKPDFIKTMTDIRSSNEIRLSRVAGELIVPCKLRMITISNPINDENGNPRFLNTFPNGVMPIMELIKSAEDVARYDGFLLIPKVTNRFNPFSVSLEGEPIERKAYPHKMGWVTTREPDNVIFDEGVEGYIWEKAEILNDLFECNFPLFGTTSAKKLARFSVALASLLINVDESYENIIVTKEIVDYMVEYLSKVYTDNTFKLDIYTKEYRSYNEYTEQDIEELTRLYTQNATLLDFLNGTSRTTRANLNSVSGLTGDRFYPVFNKMVADKFIRLSMDNVYPTDKFRKVFALIDKDFSIDKGEMAVEDYVKNIERKYKA